MATAAPMQVASDEAVVDPAAVGMAEDMPCCPKQSPVPDCGKDCLFMAMCAVEFLCNAGQAAGLVMPLGLASVFSAGNDMDLPGLSQGPPPRPPKL